MQCLYTMTLALCSNQASSIMHSCLRLPQRGVCRSTSSCCSSYPSTCSKLATHTHSTRTPSFTWLKSQKRQTMATLMYGPGIQPPLVLCPHTCVGVARWAGYQRPKFNRLSRKQSSEFRSFFCLPRACFDWFVPNKSALRRSRRNKTRASDAAAKTGGQPSYGITEDTVLPQQ